MAVDKGQCVGVSVGPGDKNQITLEALEIIKNADIIFLPTAPKEECTAYKIVKEMIPAIDDKEIMCETFTMTRESKVLKERHQEIFDKTIALLDSGKNVAFLALGEVALYSTYIYIHEMLIDAGYKSDFIPGISSVAAAAAKLGFALASGNQNLHIFANTDDLPISLELSGTKVFMKNRKNLDELIVSIKEYAASHPNTYAGGVSNCGMPGEIIARNVDELDNLSGYFTVIIVKEK